MENIIFEKIYQDNECVQLKVIAITQYIKVLQTCYVSEKQLKERAMLILKYVEQCNKESYIEFGKKEGRYTAAFSMLFLPASKTGHLNIEMDMEIEDNHTRNHRCVFYVYSDLGMVERFAKKMFKLYEADVGYSIDLLG